MTKDILFLSMESPENNKDLSFDIFGVTVNVKEMGVNYNSKLMLSLVNKYADDFDVIAVSGVANPIQIGKVEIAHQVLRQIKLAAGATPVVDGANLREILVPWSMNYFSKKNPGILTGKKLGFYAGAVQHYLIDELKQLQGQMVFADPYFFTNTPVLIKSKKKLDSILLKTRHYLQNKKVSAFKDRDFSKTILKKNPIFNDFFKSDVFFLNGAQLQYIKLQDLSGKTVIIDRLDEKSEEALKAANAATVYQCLPNVQENYFRSFTKLEALFQCLKEESSPLEKEEIERFINQFDLSPKEVQFEKEIENDVVQKFAFIIHPLDKFDLLKIPCLPKKLRRNKHMASFLDSISHTFPGFHYGRITGIVSDFDGTKVEGDIYTVTETPKTMLSRPVEKMYKKFLSIASNADKNGNKIMGLGAFTKIVGDAGVTVNKRSPIPVTTGNSLSAAATLWAAKYAIHQMNFVNIIDEKYDGTVMVVGATGSIGKVNSKVLSKSWKKLIIVAPKLYKLIDLKSEIQKINPNCEVICSTSANKYANECDLIITTTSAHGQKILDIDLVKPGCVICDVARPFDITKEDALRRPDVLVISSGEVELPGSDVHIGLDLGLDGKSVYACLAETALLALDKQFTSFSLSRDISYEKIYIIDQLAKKHGVKLSAIMGHDMHITDEEMALCRAHALKKREEIVEDNPRTNEITLSEELR